MLETAGIAFGIFLLRLLGNALTTARLIFLHRDKILTVSILGFFEALTFTIAIGAVVSNLDSIVNLFMYCLGYAVGGHIAMVLEKQLLEGYVVMRATSPTAGQEIANNVREKGLGATAITGQGVQGEVIIVESIVERHNVKQWLEIVQKTDRKAFITSHGLSSRMHGHIPGVRPGLARLINRH